MQAVLFGGNCIFIRTFVYGPCVEDMGWSGSEGIRRNGKCLAFVIYAW